MSASSKFRDCDTQVEFSFTGSFQEKLGGGSQRRDLSIDICAR